MSALAVSTYSLREQFGPLKFEFTTPDGHDTSIELPYPKLLSLSDFPERARDEFGVDAIEVVAFQFEGLDDPELTRFAAALLRSGVELRNVAIDVGDLLDPNAQKRAADIDLMKQWIDRFAAMGSQFVRVNPGSALNPHEDDALPDFLVEALRELGEHAAARGTRLLVENHGGPSSNPAWMLALLDAVGNEHVGLLLDLGNFDVLGVAVMAVLFGGSEGGIAPLLDDLDLTSLYEGIASLAGSAELVHVKVHEVDDAGDIRAVDLSRAFTILADHGYDGPLTIEYEGVGGDPWAKTRRIVDVTRPRFVGSANSEGPPRKR